MVSILSTPRLRKQGKNAFLFLHELAHRAGLIVLPKHYYVPIPDLRTLRRTKDIWAKRSHLRGVSVDLDAQVNALQTLVRPFQLEYNGNAAFRNATKSGFGPGFGYIEAQALHGFVRGGKPRRIIEVGSGVSTFCMVQAAALNVDDGHPVDITCIEPYPSNWLSTAPVKLIPKPVETVPLTVFDHLESGDLLFIDSTHTIRTGGDVTHIVLEILPRLAPGVIVHFHDIYLPFDYQRDADRSIFQWMETALLHAYLVGNSGIDILFCLSHLHYDRADELKIVFPDYNPEPGEDGLSSSDAVGHFPSSIYLRVCGPVAATPPLASDEQRQVVDRQVFERVGSGDEIQTSKPCLS